MSIRIATNLDLNVGLEGDVTQRLFGGDALLAELLDTLAHGESGAYQLDVGESNVVLDLGDVVDVRYVYIVADGEFDVSFGGGVATSALINGSGGTYPTAFAGGEHLDLLVDDVAVVVPFTVDDQTRDQVLARINYALSIAGFGTHQVAYANGGQLQLKSPSTGLGSMLEVVSTSTPAALTALGFTSGQSAQGVSNTPDTSPMHVFRPADPDSTNASFGVKSYFLGTIKTTAITVSNVSGELLNLKVFVGGDLVPDAC
jgi:hypothetical protein